MLLPEKGEIVYFPEFANCLLFKSLFSVIEQAMNVLKTLPKSKPPLQTKEKSINIILHLDALIDNKEDIK